MFLLESNELLFFRRYNKSEYFTLIAQVSLLNQCMDKTLHEEFYGQKSIEKEVIGFFHENEVKPHSDKIRNIMAFSKAFSVEQYDSLEQQETILN